MRALQEATRQAIVGTILLGIGVALGCAGACVATAEWRRDDRWQKEVCERCGAMRDVTEYSVRWARSETRYWTRTGGPQDGAVTRIARGLLPAHQHRWLIYDAGLVQGCGCVCLASPADDAHRVAVSPAAATFLEEVRSTLGDDAARAWLAALLEGRANTLPIERRYGKRAPRAPLVQWLARHELELRRP